jgi:cobyrinic acid a,c-diamide synthase
MFNMQITRQMVAAHVADYLRQRASLQQLVDWAETSMMEAEFESPAVRDVVARIGVADVRAFGMNWEDCRKFLSELGF